MVDRYLVRLVRRNSLTAISKAVYANCYAAAVQEFERHTGLDVSDACWAGWEVMLEQIDEEDFEDALWRYNYAPTSQSMKAG